MTKNVRVRFAPSPTGPLHIGGVRTALYNYLFARKHGGSIILRIEDTDQKRLVEGAEAYITEALSWAGISFDEGVREGGAHKPYKQSERCHIYRKYVDLMLENGTAYYAFDTPEELEKLREAFNKEKKVFQYDINTRSLCRNSLNMSEAELQTLLEKKVPHVIRVKIPENKEVVVNDLIRGQVKVKSDMLDDKVLMKADGLPTYHLANVVDDYLMKITHVIRGEEWLPSAPLHVLLYHFLGCADSMPEFAHLPLILKPEGHGKLSKRDGDKHGFPVFPLNWKDPLSGEVSAGYRESGYIPEAFVNMLALLGWNPGDENEIFSMQELIESFSLDRVNKAGAKFNPEKNKWFNQQYLRKLSEEELVADLKKILSDKGVDVSEDVLKKTCSLYKERVSFVHEIASEAFFVFKAPDVYDEKVLHKKCKPEAPSLLESIRLLLNQNTSWDAVSLKKAVDDWMTSEQIPAGKIMLPLRLALVGSLKGPDLFDIMELLSKEETLSRIDKFLPVIKQAKRTD